MTTISSITPQTGNAPGALAPGAEATTPILQKQVNNPTAGGTGTAPDSATFSPEAVEANQAAAAENSIELSEAEQEEIRKLQQRDAEVRRHEAAHLGAAGPYALGGASFTYTRGPNGRQYATGGEVSIDVSAASTPEATLRKAEVIRRAAVAPATPSAQDRAVAAQAGQLAAEARREIAAEGQGIAQTDESTLNGLGEESSEPNAPIAPLPEALQTAAFFVSDPEEPQGPTFFDARS